MRVALSKINCLRVSEWYFLASARSSTLRAARNRTPRLVGVGLAAAGLGRDAGQHAADILSTKDRDYAPFPNRVSACALCSHPCFPLLFRFRRERRRMRQPAAQSATSSVTLTPALYPVIRAKKWAEAIAFEATRLCRRRSQTDRIAAWPRNKRGDAQGVLLPGFTRLPYSFHGWLPRLTRVDLKRRDHRRRIQKRVKAYADVIPTSLDSRHGLDYPTFAPSGFQTRRHLTMSFPLVPCT